MTRDSIQGLPNDGYTVSREPFAAGLLGFPMSLDAFVTSDNPWSLSRDKGLSSLSRDKGDVEDERPSLEGMIIR
jgi:hypothetical protein